MQKNFTLAGGIAVIGTVEHERLRAAAANSNIGLEMVNGGDRRVHTLIVVGETLRSPARDQDLVRH